MVRGRRGWSALGLSAAAVFLFAACAGGGTTDAPGTQACETDIDCPIVNAAGENLSCFEGQCLTNAEIDARGGGGTRDVGSLEDTTQPGEDTGGGEDTVSPPRDTGGGQDTTQPPQDTGGVEDTGGGGEDTVSPPEDTGPVGCNPPCGPSEFCNANNVCEPTTSTRCARQGDPCDATVGDQGAFWCAEVPNGGGVCVLKCQEDFSASGCTTGEYCRNIGSEAQPRLACIPADCSTDIDCPNGSCINFDNQYGTCIEGGTIPQDASCTIGGSARCVPGTFCAALQNPAAVGDPGVCRRLCDPWGSPSGCPTGQACDIFTSREGICNPDIETPPVQPFQACQVPGNLCGDATRCFDINGGVCLKYCRDGFTDCASVAGTACNNYVFPGERSYGICLTSCFSTDDCCQTPPCLGQRCQGGICLNTCSTSTVVQDCCGGTTPCDFQCVGGICE